MRVLSFSLDPQMLDSKSTTAKRVAGYGERTKLYSVIIPTADKKVVELSSSVTVHGTGGRNKLIRLLKLYRLANRLIKEKKFEVVSTQDPYYLGLAGYLLAKRHKIGFEVQVLGLYNLTPLRIALARWLLHRAGSMRVLSDYLKQRLLSEEFSVPTAERMQVVPIYAEVSTLGFDENKLSPEEREKFQQGKLEFQQKYQERFNLLTVGRIIGVKNYPLQLKAVAALRAEFPSLLLHIVGDGEDMGALKEMAAQLDIEEHVIFHGPKYHTELGVFFTQADCFVLSSDSEGWAMVVIEAATAGLPVVMTNVGCAGTVIKNEDSGLVVPAGDEAALTEALRRVISEPALRASLEQGALAAIENISTFDEIAAGCVKSWQLAIDNKNKI